MEQWRELFDYSIIAKSNNKDDRRESCLVNHRDLSENVLSPVTNLMLNAVVKIFDSDENLIINFPKKIYSKKYLTEDRKTMKQFLLNKHILSKYFKMY